MGEAFSHFYLSLSFLTIEKSQESNLLSTMDRNCRIGAEHSIICFRIGTRLSNVKEHSTICFRIALELSNTRATSDNPGPAVKKIVKLLKLMTLTICSGPHLFKGNISG
jgi:hypothetical protein